MTSIDRADAYALLTDGRCVRLRSVTPRDWQPVHDFAATLGPDSLYRRFFGAPRDPGKLLADLVCAPQPEHGPAGHGGLLAVLDGAVVGLAEWYRAGGSDQAEIAFAVSDALHGHGIATLLAEHLITAVERAGIRRMIAVTQGENRDMLGVFVALGLPVQRDWDGGVCTLAIDLGFDSAARAALLDASAKREGLADEASLRSLLAPRSIAVLGDAGQPATRRLLAELAAFAGPVYRGGPDGAGLPADARPELAVVTAPPADAPAAARRCAELGVRALIVTATGFARDEGLELLNVCRGAGMRLVGPGSLGVAAPHGADGFSALLSAAPPDPGPAGVAVQSGGVGLALLSHLDRLGVGVSTFAAVGEKYDVSANDLLLHWEQDSDTKIGLLHVESFGNPRKFAHTARRLSRLIPLLAVDPEQSPSQARTALYAQAGIVAVPSLGALVDAAALAAHQPPPRGPRVAVLGNTRGMVSLAVQACIKAGLEVTGAVDVTPSADAAGLAGAIADQFAADGGRFGAAGTHLAAPDGNGTAAAAGGQPSATRPAATSRTPAGAQPSVTVSAAASQTSVTSSVAASTSSTAASTSSTAASRTPVGARASATGSAAAEDPAAPQSVLLALAPTAPEAPDLSAAVDAVPADVPVLAMLAQQPESVAVRRCGILRERVVPCYNDAAAAAGALAALDRAARVKRAHRAPAAQPEGIDLVALRALVDTWMKAEPGGGDLDPAQNEALLGTLGLNVGLGGVRLGLRARTATVTAWQDQVFGPVLAGLRGHDREAVTMLAPVDAGIAESVAAQVAGSAAPALADLLRRVSVLVDACPEVASFQLACAYDGGGVRPGVSETRLMPAESQNPYLRRLRRAPVE